MTSNNAGTTMMTAKNASTLQQEKLSVCIKRCIDSIGMVVQIASLTKEAKQRAPGLADLNKAINKRQADMTAMEKQINAVKDSMYGPISKQVSSKPILALVVSQWL